MNQDSPNKTAHKSVKDGPVLRENINATMASIEAKKQAELTAMLDQLDDKVLVEWSQNAGIVAEGEIVYKGICIACHGPDLKGGIGRSLVDKEWAYGGKPMDLFNQVLNGTPKGSKGYNGMPMQSFKNDLGPEKIAKVVAFVISKSPGVEK